MKKTFSILLITILILTTGLFTGCLGETSSVDATQAQQQEQTMKDMNNQVGLPNIKNWTEKKMMKDIIELRDNANLVTYLYIHNMDGKFTYLGQAIGFGLPYSTEYTNPERIADSMAEGGYAVLPQADPNGLFSAEGVSATWIQYIDAKTGNREIMYFEPEVVVRQTKFDKSLCEPWSIPDNY